MNEFINKYTEDLKKTIDSLDKNSVNNAVDKIFQAYKNNKQIFMMGNGGSASTSSHFACDLAKGTIMEGKQRFRVMSLNDNMALITAFSNDYGYEYVFVEQLKNLINDGDIVIAISASGNSANIVNAINYAKERGAYIIGFSGFMGGHLKKESDLCIHVENDSYGQVEDIHMFLCHMISLNIRKYIEEM